MIPGSLWIPPKMIPTIRDHRVVAQTGLFQSMQAPGKEWRARWGPPPNRSGKWFPDCATSVISSDRPSESDPLHDQRIYCKALVWPIAGNCRGRRPKGTTDLCPSWYSRLEAALSLTCSRRRESSHTTNRLQSTWIWRFNAASGPENRRCRF